MEPITIGNEKDQRLSVLRSTKQAKQMEKILKQYPLDVSCIFKQTLVV